MVKTIDITPLLKLPRDDLREKLLYIIDHHDGQEDLLFDIPDSKQRKRYKQWLQYKIKPDSKYYAVDMFDYKVRLKMKTKNNASDITGGQSNIKPESTTPMLQNMTVTISGDRLLLPCWKCSGTGELSIELTDEQKKEILK